MRIGTFSVTLAVLVLAACSSGGRRAAPPAAAPSVARVQAPSPTPSRSGGGVAFVGQDLPLEQVLAQSQASGKPAMLTFVAGWCGYCRLLESQTLSDPSVGAHMAGYTNARYDADSPTGRALTKRYGISGFPTLVRVDAAGNKVKTFEGYDPPSDFVRRIPRP